jgi:hypothetical protein
MSSPNRTIQAVRICLERPDGLVICMEARSRLPKHFVLEAGAIRERFLLRLPDTELLSNVEFNEPQRHRGRKGKRKRELYVGMQLGMTNSFCGLKSYDVLPEVLLISSLSRFGNTG